MKRTKFCWFLLIAGWIIFISTDHSIGGTVLLVAAGIYAMLDAAHDVQKNKEKK